MRVTHVVPALFSRDGGVVGGAERYVLELARHMADEVPTRLVTFGDQAREEQVGDLEVRVIGSPWYVRGQRNNPLAAGLIPEVLRTDVVHCHQQRVVASTLSALIGKAARKDVFVTDLGGGGWDISAYISTDRLYDGHLHISRYSRTIYGHASADWAHEIFGGVDTARFSPDPAIERSHRVLYVGRILPHKGVDYLVEAVAPDLSLDIIGKPYDEAFLRELNALAGSADVRFHHGFDDAQLVRAYQSALCIVLPSVYQTRGGDTTLVPELLGQTLLEGMACGTPAICTDVASMPEVVEDGVTGFVVPPNDPAALREKIERFARNPAERERMGAAARERVIEKFAWPAVVKHCLEIYRGEH